MGSQQALLSDKVARQERFTGFSLTPMSMFAEMLFVYTGGTPIFHTHCSLFICVFLGGRTGEWRSEDANQNLRTQCLDQLGFLPYSLNRWAKVKEL